MIQSFPCALMALIIAQTGGSTPESEVDAALSLAGLSAKTARFEPSTLGFFRQGEFTTPLYTAMSENPWKGPFLMDVKRRELAGYAGRVNDSLVAGGLWVGWATRRTLVGNPNVAEEALAKRDSALGDAIALLRRKGIVGNKVPSYANVPKPVQQAAALVLATVARARDFRALAIKDMGDPGSAFRQVVAGTSDDDDVLTTQRTIDLYRRFHPNLMAAGGHDLLLAIQSASAMVAKVPPSAGYSWQLDTAWGTVRLSGGSATNYPDESGLLIVDTGGSDTYLNAGCTKSEKNWCSVVIDTEGNDKYVSAVPLQTTPMPQFAGRKSAGGMGPGGAALGYAAIFDLEGDDLYRSHRPGIGSGRLGVGVVCDAKGKDTYDAYADSQGCGLFGAGILEDDGSENDAYNGFSQVQGVGLTQGFGYLVDRGGNDVYSANDEAIDFPSPQSDKHNVSMAQGAGNGRRADYLEGESLAGGFGVLYDLSGDDQYRCGIFGQGVGYWMSVGALWDGGGKDTYLGQWYVQGACAHFAIGYLEDEGGDDAYTAPMNMAMGAGHDFSVGFLIDRAGNDVYRGPNLSLGAGNANGIGWFADLAGNDSYASTGITLGSAAEAPKDSLRSRALCLGVFMDLGGLDMYPPSSAWAKNGGSQSNWTAHLSNPSESQVGVFLDR